MAMNASGYVFADSTINRAGRVCRHLTCFSVGPPPRYRYRSQDLTRYNVTQCLGSFLVFFARGFDCSVLMFVRNAGSICAALIAMHNKGPPPVILFATDQC